MSSRILKNFNPKQTSSVKQYKPTMGFLSSSGPPFFVLALCVCPLLCLCYTDFRAFWAQEKPAFRPFFTKILRQISSRSFVKKIGWIFASVFCYVSPWLTKLRVSYFSYMNFFCKLYGAEGHQHPWASEIRAKGVFIPSRCKMINTTSRTEKYFLCFCSARGIVFMGCN